MPNRSPDTNSLLHSSESFPEGKKYSLLCPLFAFADMSRLEERKKRSKIRKRVKNKKKNSLLFSRQIQTARSITQ